MPPITLTIDITQGMFDELVERNYGQGWTAEDAILSSVLKAAVRQLPELELNCRTLYVLAEDQAGIEKAPGALDSSEGGVPITKLS